MSLLLLLSLLMQALVGLGALLLLGQARRQQPESWQGVLFASQLGFALAAASAASSLPAHWLPAVPGRKPAPGWSRPIACSASRYWPSPC